MSRVQTSRRRVNARRALAHTFVNGTCSVCGESVDWLFERRWGRMGGPRGRVNRGQLALQLTVTAVA